MKKKLQPTILNRPRITPEEAMRITLQEDTRSREERLEAAKIAGSRTQNIMTMYRSLGLMFVDSTAVVGAYVPASQSYQGAQQ